MVQSWAALPTRHHWHIGSWVLHSIIIQLVSLGLAVLCHSRRLAWWCHSNCRWIAVPSCHSKCVRLTAPLCHSKCWYWACYTYVSFKISTLGLMHLTSTLGLPHLHAIWNGDVRFAGLHHAGVGLHAPHVSAWFSIPSCHLTCRLGVSSAHVVQHGGIELPTPLCCLIPWVWDILMFLSEVGPVLAPLESGVWWWVGVGVSKTEGFHGLSMCWAVPCVMWCYALLLHSTLCHIAVCLFVQLYTMLSCWLVIHLVVWPCGCCLACWLVV